MAKGKFIVIDGIDGSGKGTQAELLVKRIQDSGREARLFDFPRYGERSATLVEEYLNGTYGTADEVGPHRGSIFYAVDRYAASKSLCEALDRGVYIVSNRYVSANKGHQASKIADKGERAEFINWLNELEYGIFGIPVPDVTIFLHVPPEIGYRLVLDKPFRSYLRNKKQDIHEADMNHLKNAENAYLEMIENGDSRENWVKIPCHKDHKILPISEISVMIGDVLEKHKIVNLCVAE